jgi:hypothetical protein
MPIQRGREVSLVDIIILNAIMEMAGKALLPL